MYQDHFRLTAAPFSIAPDPRFLYMSSRHREAIAHLLYGVRGEGGFVLLTGEIGTGKTTLCRCLLGQMPASSDVAFVLNPRLGVRDLLATICEEFHVVVPAVGPHIKQLVDVINRHLLQAHAAGRLAILIIDEAQNLQPQVLELLRLLTNLETNTRKLLQIILIGQPELQDLLARPEMRQVAQRVVARFHLTRLSREEVAAYVRHRLAIAGTRAPLVPDRLMGRLYRLTDGVPRLINLVCDRALLGAYVEGRAQVTRRVLERAAGEVFGRPTMPRHRQAAGLRFAFIGAACIALATVLVHFGRPGPAALEGVAPPALAAPAAVSQPAEAVAMPVARAATETPPPADNLDWPSAPRALSEKLAFRDLFRLYGADYDPGAGPAPCLAAAAAQMRCLAERGGLADLLRFNQPALLTLEDAGGRYYALLTAVDGRSATLRLAGETRRVPLAAMAQAWAGNFLLLWRPPPGIKDALSLGSRGQSVIWLRSRLAAAAGEDARVGAAATFDDDLLRRVKAFQMSEGLVPDGVAGALTLVRLNMRMDRALPRLTVDSETNADVLHP